MASSKNPLKRVQYTFTDSESERGPGRPSKYSTDEERVQARRAHSNAYYKRKRISKSQFVSNIHKAY